MLINEIEKDNAVAAFDDRWAIARGSFMTQNGRAGEIRSYIDIVQTRGEKGLFTDDAGRRYRFRARISGRAVMLVVS